MNSSSSKKFTNADFQAMARALELARNGLYTTSPNPRVGAVIVKNGKIIGEGWHHCCGGEHAEVAALRNATEDVRGASCYITLEPCNHHGKTPPCSQALIDAGITRVVAAMIDPNPAVAGVGVRQLKNSSMEVFTGLMEAEARLLNQGFIRRMEKGRPWVVSKLAMGVDGRTALANGESQWISCSESRQDVQRLRAQVCAIITGSGTVIADNPRMTVRLDFPNIQLDGETAKPRQPLRVVIDGQQQLTPEFKIFQQPALIVLSEDAVNFENFLAAGVRVMQVPVVNGKLDLNIVMSKLALEYEVNELMLESGAGLNGAFLNAGLIDQINIYMAPKLMGDDARGLFHLPQIKHMEDNINLEFIDIQRIGSDVKIIAKVDVQQ